MKVTFFCNNQAHIADSIDEGFFGQLKLGTSKLLFGGTQASHCIVPYAQMANCQLPMPKATFIESAIYSFI